MSIGWPPPQGVSGGGGASGTASWVANTGPNTDTYTVAGLSFTPRHVKLTASSGFTDGGSAVDNAIFDSDANDAEITFGSSGSTIPCTLTLLPGGFVLTVSGSGNAGGTMNWSATT